MIEFKLSFRYTKSRVLFNKNDPSWSTCMDKCLMYSEARAPSYSTPEELGDLVMWALATTVDKMAMARGNIAPYPAFPSFFFRMAYRFIFWFNSVFPFIKNVFVVCSCAHPFAY